MEQEQQHHESIGRLYLVYQPIFDRTREPVKFEVLMRTDSLRTPEEIISESENQGSIQKLDKRILYRFLEDYESLVRQGIDLAPYVFSINLSPLSLIDSELVTDILDMVAEADGCLPASILEVELLESKIPDGVENAIKQNLTKLRRQNIGVALDDVGNGHACLHKMTWPMFSNIKVDGVLVGRINEGETRNLISLIISQASFAKKKVTVEKIETADQISLLEAMGANYFQGFFLSRPKTIEELSQFLLGKQQNSNAG